jgi:hypothetical protein
VRPSIRSIYTRLLQRVPTSDLRSPNREHDLRTPRDGCIRLLEENGLVASDRERESVERLRFRIEEAYRDGPITERDIPLEWLTGHGWMD